jgi:MGT family glycosyltransferase
VGERHAFLVAHWEGGGNTPPMLAVVRRLIARAHTVRVISDPCNRAEVEQTGAAFISWTRAPHRGDKSPESDLIKDWEVPPGPAILGRLRDRIFIGPSLAYAQDILEQLNRSPADVVITSEMLFGPMVAAEAAAVPCVVLSANVYLFPREGVPPFGPGLMPATNVLARLRDRVIRMMTVREFGKGTATFNETRRVLGLPPVRHPFDQLDRLAASLMLTSEAFDFKSSNPPAHVVYAGPELEDPAWSEPWRSPWPASDRRPLVLVGFSSTFQNQVDVLRRVIDALKDVDARAVVTAGPAIDPALLPIAPNVHVCASAPHNEVLKEAAAVVTHCGHGTVIRSLAAGVPLVCVPMGRDQNENAARVVFHGAGVRVKPTDSAATIRDAIRKVLASPSYRQRAAAIGDRIVEDARRSRAVPILEEVAAQRQVPVSRAS